MRPLMLVRVGLVGGCVLAAGGLVSGAWGQDQGGLDAFAACGRIAEDAARHACLDAALRASGMLEGQAPAAPASEAVPTAPPAATPSALQPGSASLPPAPAPAIQARAAPPPPPPSRRQREEREPDREPDREPYLTSIVTARLIGNHTLEIATPDAGRWVSTERETFRRAPDEGDAMEILPAALGGYRCRLERSTIFPCRRVD